MLLWKLKPLEELRKLTEVENYIDGYYRLPLFGLIIEESVFTRIHPMPSENERLSIRSLFKDPDFIKLIDEVIEE